MKLPNLESETEFDAAFGDDVWHDAARAICEKCGHSGAVLSRAGGSEHIVFFVGDALVLKIYRPFRDCYGRERRALETVGGKISLTTPKIIATGNFEGFDYLLMTRLSGDFLTRAEWLKVDSRSQRAFVEKLAVALREIHEFSPGGFADNWAAFVEDRAATFVRRQIAAGVNPNVIEALPKYLDENLKLVPTSAPTIFMHADVHFGNLTIAINGETVMPTGLFDFADSRRGHFEYDFLAVGVLMLQGQKEIQRTFFRAYGYAESELDDEMRRRMMMLTMLYETADLRRYALRLSPEAVNFTLAQLERGIWSFAD